MYVRTTTNRPAICTKKALSISLTILPIINAINDRSAIYSNILENDDEIIKYALSEVLGDNNDR